MQYDTFKEAYCMESHRCSNSYVVLSNGQTLYCENTVADIDKQLSIGNEVIILDVSDQNTKLSVHKKHIVSYSFTD